MLAYILALAVGLGSLGIYLAAFFFPEIHRKNDFIWSGVGLFYALVLWVCAGRITGSLVLGQVAGVALLGWSITQMLSLRRQITPRQQQTELPSADEVKNTVQEKVSNLSLSQRLSQLQQRVTGITGVKDRVQETITPTAATGEAMPAGIVLNTSPPTPIDAIEQDEDNSRVQIIDKRTSIPEQPADIAATTETESASESVPQVISPNSPEPDELVQAARESAVEDFQAGQDSLIRSEELVLKADELIEPALTEEEAIALAVETTLAEATKAEASVEEQEASSKLIHPNPPDPELVEAAIRDAQEKSEDFSPPQSVDTNSAEPLKKDEQR